MLGGECVTEVGDGEADLAGLVEGLLAVVVARLARPGGGVVRERVQLRELGRCHEG